MDNVIDMRKTTSYLKSLPLSSLIRIAVADSQKCEAQSDRFRLEMYKWHTPESDGRCAVCMAGAVLAQTLSFEDYKFYGFGRDLDLDDVLSAINQVRRGFFKVALECLGKVPEAFDDYSLADNAELEALDQYIDSRLTGAGRADWADYVHAADRLQAIGF